MSGHGNVAGRAPRAFNSHRRFIALCDVLGMKAWLDSAGCTSIAQTVDQALAACDQSSSGCTREGSAYGPSIGTAYFSDSLLVWSPDDSWASFAAICLSLKMIVGTALRKGVPLRGALAIGDTVCCPKSSAFVGRAIAEAYQWAESGCPYKSVGVSLTPCTVRDLRSKLRTDPLANCWRFGLPRIDETILSGESSSDWLLVWHEGVLFVNHWAHGMFLSADVEKLFSGRNLIVPAAEESKVASKIEQMIGFQRVGQSTTSFEVPSGEHVDECLREFARLAKLRVEREQ